MNTPTTPSRSIGIKLNSFTKVQYHQQFFILIFFPFSYLYAFNFALIFCVISWFQIKVAQAESAPAPMPSRLNPDRLQFDKTKPVQPRRSQPIIRGPSETISAHNKKTQPR
ncbi:hypothetical protein CR513_28886, partial [Mucuna pruriens]